MTETIVNSEIDLKINSTNTEIEEKLDNLEKNINIENIISNTCSHKTPVHVTEYTINEGVIVKDESEYGGNKTPNNSNNSESDWVDNLSETEENIGSLEGARISKPPKPKTLDACSQEKSEKQINNPLNNNLNDHIESEKKSNENSSTEVSKSLKDFEKFVKNHKIQKLDERPKDSPSSNSISENDKWKRDLWDKDNTTYQKNYRNNKHQSHNRSYHDQSYSNSNVSGPSYDSFPDLHVNRNFRPAHTQNQRYNTGYRYKNRNYDRNENERSYDKYDRSRVVRNDINELGNKIEKIQIKKNVVIKVTDITKRTEDNPKQIRCENEQNTIIQNPVVFRGNRVRQSFRGVGSHQVRNVAPIYDNPRPQYEPNYYGYPPQVPIDPNTGYMYNMMPGPFFSGQMNQSYAFNQPMFYGMPPSYPPLQNQNQAFVMDPVYGLVPQSFYNQFHQQ